jgi:hypothetical protein
MQCPRQSRPGALRDLVGPAPVAPGQDKRHSAPREPLREGLSETGGGAGHHAPATLVINHWILHVFQVPNGYLRAFCSCEGASPTPQPERAWDAWQAGRYRRGEIDQRPGYTGNPFRPR